MSTDFLRRVELISGTGRQVVRLKFHEEAPPEAAFTLEHYLRLVLFIARVLTEGKQAAAMSKEDREKYRKLAATDSDFELLREDSRFLRMLN